ncbi:hypothetical protein ACLI4Q_12295 [Natrialbaceae archaeon A-CW1-1]
MAASHGGEIDGVHRHEGSFGSSCSVVLGFNRKSWLTTCEPLEWAFVDSELSFGDFEGVFDAPARIVLPRLSATSSR